MDKTSIIVESTNHVSGKNQQLTIQNVNPQASRGHLATWGQMTAALTKDSYGKTVRIDRIECDNDPRPQRPITQLRIYMKNSGGSSLSPRNIPLDTKTFTTDTTSLASVTISGETWCRFPLLINTPYDVPPHISVETTGQATFARRTFAYGFDNENATAKDLWACEIVGNTLEAATITIHVHFDETTTYQPCDFDITVNVEEG